jgi:hypothetical protein
MTTGKPVVEIVVSLSELGDPVPFMNRSAFDRGNRRSILLWAATLVTIGLFSLSLGRIDERGPSAAGIAFMVSLVAVMAVLRHLRLGRR